MSSINTSNKRSRYTTSQESGVRPMQMTYTNKVSPNTLTGNNNVVGRKGSYATMAPFTTQTDARSRVPSRMGKSGNHSGSMRAPLGQNEQSRMYLHTYNEKVYGQRTSKQSSYPDVQQPYQQQRHYLSSTSPPPASYYASRQNKTQDG